MRALTLISQLRMPSHKIARERNVSAMWAQGELNFVIWDSPNNPSYPQFSISAGSWKKLKLIKFTSDSNVLIEIKVEKQSAANLAFCCYIGSVTTAGIGHQSRNLSLAIHQGKISFSYNRIIKNRSSAGWPNVISPNKPLSGKRNWPKIQFSRLAHLAAHPFSRISYLAEWSVCRMSFGIISLLSEWAIWPIKPFRRNTMWP